MIELESELCKVCGAGYYLLSGYCDHCNSIQEGSAPDIMQKRIAQLEAQCRFHTKDYELQYQRIAELELSNAQLITEQVDYTHKIQQLERENAELKAATAALEESHNHDHAGISAYSEALFDRDDVGYTDGTRMISQLRLQVVRLREAVQSIQFILVGKTGNDFGQNEEALRHNTENAVFLLSKIISETSSAEAKEVLEPVLGLLKRVAEYDRCNQGSIAKEITRLERLCND